MTNIQVGKPLPFRAKGYITERKYLWGTVAEIEKKIGYHSGRLRTGFFVAHLDRIPNLDEFDLAGYSNVAEHRFASSGLTSKIDVNKVKQMALDKMQKIGSKNLIKIFANTRHNASMSNDDQYPPGDGVPQWKLTKEMSMTVIKEVPANSLGLVRI